jgi:hypothetical protein
MSIMFIADLSKVRETRQVKTNKGLAETIIHTENFTDKDLKSFLNFKSFDRLTELLGENRQYVYDLCTGKREITAYDYALTMAHGCAILASRQGSKDESFVLDEINKVSKGFGIYVQSLNNQDLRPTKDGQILNKEEFKKSGLSKLDCLKSIDGVINGKVEGYIFAKIVFGEGGHQDNVFHEAAQFGDWAQKFGKEDKIYVLLIDTDLKAKYNELKEKYDSGNVWVVNHTEFQQRLGIE